MPWVPSVSFAVEGSVADAEMILASRADIAFNRVIETVQRAAFPIQGICSRRRHVPLTVCIPDTYYSHSIVAGGLELIS